MAKLYLVSTPIGNLEDITFRAKRVLLETEIIACEDTRKTGFLLKKINPNKKPKPRLLSYYEENELKRIPEIINLLKQDKNVALVSNAGTPTISDPGYKLVRECINQGIQIEVVPGPSAILTSLILSGLPTNKFLFLGFLPKKRNKRRSLFKNVHSIYRYIEPTIIFFESPYRLIKTLRDLKEIFGDIEIVICREMTKIHEEIRREKISKSIKHFNQVKPKGELTVLFNYGHP